MDLGWIVSISLILFDILLALGLGPLVSRYWTKKIVKDIWNQKVELEDLDGTVIKVPQVKVVNGEEKVEMVVGPLWMSVMYAAGTLAAQQIKMSMLSAKGKLSRQLNTLSEAGEAIGMDPKAAALLQMLPKRWVGPAALIMQLMGKNAPTGTQTPHRGGGGPI